MEVTYFVHHDRFSDVSDGHGAEKHALRPFSVMVSHSLEYVSTFLLSLNTNFFIPQDSSGKD